MAVTRFSKQDIDRRLPACPMCQGREFRKESGKIDGDWGFSQHRVRILCCLRCGYVMLFDLGVGFFEGLD